MKLRELIKHLLSPDHAPAEINIMELGIVFDTVGSNELMLLSVYFHNAKIHIDIGEGDE